MAIDPRISLGLEPVRINTPLENQAAVLAVRQREAQVRSQQLEMQQQEKRARDEAQLQAIWSQYGDNPEEAIRQTRKVNPLLALRMQGEIDDSNARANQARKAQIESEIANTQNLLRYLNPLQKGDTAALQRLRPLLVEADPQLDAIFPQGLDTDEEWAQFQNGMHAGETAVQHLTHMQKEVEKPADFTLTPGAKRFDAKGNVIAEVPRDPTAQGGFTLSPGSVRYDAQGNVIASRPESPKASGGAPANDAALIDAILANPGIYANLTPTVKSRISAKLAARGFTFENAGKPSTGQQKRAFGFFQRAKQADDEIQNLEGEIAKLGAMGQIRLGYQGPGANWIQTPVGQAYTQAQRAFTEARLRKDSGAAIPEHEYENDRRTYFVQPGDNQSTIQQKNRARAGLLSSLAFESGPAMREDYGDAADEVIQGYKSRATAAPSEAAPANVSSVLQGKGPGRYTLSDGSVWEIRSKGSAPVKVK